MTREFVMMPEFDRKWNQIGLEDPDLKELQDTILKNPLVGAVMAGTGGLRKLRFPLPGQGKSGGVRVAYVDFPIYGITYIITAYPKSEKDNLSKKERNEIAKVIQILEKGLEERYLR